jgi:hypothetical protein
MQDTMSRQLGRVFFLMVLTIVCLGVVAFWLLEDPLAEYQCELEYLPARGADLGFRTGRIPVRDYAEGPVGIVHIDPRGPMYAAGFRVGDIPLAHHGGMMEFCGALIGAAHGREERIYVTTADHWPTTEPQPRELLIPRSSVR